MNKVFKYSLLRYSHSQVTGERLNIGILFFFPSVPKIVFIPWKKISLLQLIYPDFPVLVINEYLRAFEKKASLLNGDMRVNDFEKIINSHFLVKESNTLQFSEIKSVVLYNEDYATITNQYYNIYFSSMQERDAIKVAS